jgi:1-acyl-sn-glycerol-3-phosphate acyltransferase
MSRPLGAWQRLQRDLLLGLVRAIVGGRPQLEAPLPEGPFVLYANHTSHLDALLLLAALPPAVRDRVRPVAGSDYWEANALRRHIAHRVLRVVCIDRAAGGPQALEPLEQALAEGDALIVFPEGTRGAAPLPAAFKSGLFHLSRPRPGLPLVPAYLDNVRRAWPKGAPFPLPLLCTVRVAPSLRNDDAAEDKNAFLARAHAAVCRLASGAS